MSQQDLQMLENAAEISDNFRCKIYWKKLHSKTSGKAYIAEQDPVGDKYVETTILQQTEQGDWVAMRTMHPKNEDVSKLFTRIRASQENTKMQHYPLVVAMVVLSFLYGWLIKVTAIDQKPLIILRSQVFNIFLIGVIFLMAEGFIVYYILTSRMDFSYFRSVRRPRTKPYVLKKENRPASIVAQEFYGQFFAIDDSSDIDKMFGPAAGDWEDSIKTEDGSSYNEAINQLEADKYELEYQLHDKYSLVVHYQRKANTLDLVDVRDMSEAEREKYESDKADIKKELENQENSYKEKKAIIKPQIDEIKENIKRLEDEYDKKLQALVEETLTEERKKQIRNADSLVTTLKFQLASEKIKNIRNSRTIAGQYNESMAAALDAEERAMHMALYEYNKQQNLEYQIENRNGNGEMYPAKNGSSSFDSNFSMNMDLGEIINLLIKVGTVVIAFILITNGFNLVLANAAKITWPAAIFMIVLLAIIIIVWAWTSNKISRSKNYVNHSSTVDYNGRRP